PMPQKGATMRSSSVFGLQIAPLSFFRIVPQMTIYIRFQRARWVGMMALLATAGLGSLIGQTMTQGGSGLTSSSPGRGGFQLYNVTGWAGYYSVAQYSPLASSRIP